MQLVMQVMIGIAEAIILRAVSYTHLEFYMIPESSTNDSITLYRAEHFPDKWVKETDLLKGEKYVDSTVFQHGDDVGLLSYKIVKGGWQLVSFSLDMDQKVLKKENVVHYKENTGRPAGYIFAGNKRPAQDLSLIHI